MFAKKKKRLACSIAAAGLALSACSGGGASGDTITLTFNSFISEDHPYSHGFQAFMELVSEESDGRVEFETNYNAALCPSAESLNCAGDGTVDIAMSSLAYNPDMTLANIGGVAFQSGDPQAVGDALNVLYETQPEARAEYESRNVHLLFAFGDSKPVIATSQELASLDDLEGLSLRAGGAMVAGVTHVGVNAVAIAPEEIYESIERGVVQGSILPLASQLDFRLQEVADNFYDIGQHTGVYSALAFVVNTDTWDGLPEDIQQILTDASETIAASFQQDHAVPGIAAQCELLQEAGLELQQIGPDSAGQAWAEVGGAEQRADWLEAASGAVDDPEAFFDAYLDALADAEAAGAGTPENAEICADVS